MFSFPGKNRKNSAPFQGLNQHLEEKRTSVIKEFEEKHKEAVRWAKKKGIKTQELAQKGARGLAAGVAASAMVMSAGAVPTHQTIQINGGSNHQISKEIKGNAIETSVNAREDVTKEVKNELSGQNLYDEGTVSKKLTRVLKIPVKAELDDIRLNATYGIMGYESHLARYPGDNLSTHFHSDIEYKHFAKAHMAGGPGAWGYLASNRRSLTNKDIEREKYYLVAQTWLSPNWGNSSVKQWFRHRKIVVVNPANGRVVIGVVEDAGPEESTGRQFGGSPEVYEELDLFKTGPKVLMYFVEDPKDEIPLGRYGRI